MILLCGCNVFSMWLLCGCYVVDMPLLCECYMVAMWWLSSFSVVVMWFLFGFYMGCGVRPPVELGAAWAAACVCHRFFQSYTAQNRN